ncbi:MAG: hypothetical protein DHS20C13_05280 [Thermodesulfobacteriota bacterium]|nr:MAG: hypothetical protein DHS20C13_05280 [Thermodesulfobacteriota bacterium]
MRILKRISNSDNNNSVLYLALLCLLYLLITSNYLPFSTNSRSLINTNEVQFIEISKDGISTVKRYSDLNEINELIVDYGLSDKLKSGDRIIIRNNGVLVTKISARKRISLGVPIGINTASTEDLTAILGIGPELATRIIDYRTNVGKFQSIDELDNVEGIGNKKLAIIKQVGNLD